MVKRSRRAEGLPRSSYNRYEHQLSTSIDVCFLPRQHQRQRDPHRKRRRPSSIKDFLPTAALFTAEFIREFPSTVYLKLYVSTSTRNEHRAASFYSNHSVWDKRTDMVTTIFPYDLKPAHFKVIGQKTEDGAVTNATSFPTTVSRASRSHAKTSG